MLIIIFAPKLDFSMYYREIMRGANNKNRNVNQAVSLKS